MRYRPLGNSGCKVSVLALGSWLTIGSSVDQETTDALLRTALDGGINFLDTADIYAKGEAERALGRAIARVGVRRQDLVLATKVFWPMSENVNDRGLSRKHVLESCAASLRRLGTDYVDLYQCHRPDPETPVEETVRAMEDLVRQGRVLYWGVSVWSAGEIGAACAAADRTGGCRPLTNQPEYSYVQREIEAEVMPACARLGLSQIVWSPLAQGLLTGKYAGGRVPPGSRGADGERNRFLKALATPRALARAEHLAGVAQQAGLAPAQVALAWVLRRPEVSSALVGATRVEQLRENLGAAELDLPAGVLARLDQAPEA
jgi:voltage-dependent potassium channel beta subunit